MPISANAIIRNTALSFIPNIVSFLSLSPSAHFGRSGDGLIVNRLQLLPEVYRFGLGHRRELSSQEFSGLLAWSGDGRRGGPCIEFRVDELADDIGHVRRISVVAGPKLTEQMGKSPKAAVERVEIVRGLLRGGQGFIPRVLCT